MQRFINEAHTIDFDGVAWFFMKLFDFLDTDFCLTFDLTIWQWGQKDINILMSAGFYKGLADLAVPLQQALAALDDLLNSIDQQLHTILSTQETLKASTYHIETILSIGRQTTTQLALLFSRVALTRSDAAVAFVGLDPMVCDSGQKQGQRRLSKQGPAELRYSMHKKYAVLTDYVDKNHRISK